MIKWMKPTSRAVAALLSVTVAIAMLASPAHASGGAPSGYNTYFGDGFNGDFDASSLDQGLVNWFGLSYQLVNGGYHGGNSVQTGQYMGDQDLTGYHLMSSDRIYVELYTTEHCAKPIYNAFFQIIGCNYTPQAGNGVDFYDGYSDPATRGSRLSLVHGWGPDGQWIDGRWTLSRVDGISNWDLTTSQILGQVQTQISPTVNPNPGWFYAPYNYPKAWVLVESDTVSAGVSDDSGRQATIADTVPFKSDMPLYNTPNLGYLTFDNVHTETTKYETRQGAGKNSGTGGDPVNTSSGNAAFADQDLAIATKGPPLTVTRHYNNLDISSRTLGPGWRTNFDQRVSFGTGLASSSQPYSSNGIKWTTADGREDFYAGTPCQGTAIHAYAPGPARHETVVCQGDHIVATDTANTTFVFNPAGQLSQVLDRFGNGYQVYRDALGRPQDVTSRAGQNIHLVYGADGMLDSASTSDGVSVGYGHSSGRFNSVTKPGGLTYSYTYNAIGRLQTITDPSGKVIYSQDLSAGRVGAQQDGRGNGSQFVYRNGPGFGTGETKITDANGGVTTSDFNNVGFQTKRTNQEGASTAFEYNAAGDRTGLIDAIGAKTGIAYNSGGDPIAVTDPIGAVTTFSFRSDHQLSDTTDPTGKTTRFSYDSTGMLTSRDPSGPAGPTVIIPNFDGTISATVSPDGLIARTEYDARGRPVRRIDSGDRSTYINYNPDGTIASTVAPGALSTSTTYDASRRPARIDSPGGATTLFSYDNAGNQNGATDPRANETRFGYDAAYNLIETSQTINGGNVVRARYGYDTENRLVALTEPASAGATELTYSPAGHLASVTDADGAKWSYFYTARGELSAVVGPNGDVRANKYDAAGRIVSSGSATDGLWAASFSAAGRPLTVTDEAGRVTTFGYDGSGRPVANTDRIEPDGRTYSIQSALSPAGRADAEQRSRSGPGGQLVEESSAITYRYADDGALSKVTSNEFLGSDEISYTEDPETGRLIALSAPGQRTSLEYDSAGRVSNQSSVIGAGPQTISSPTTYDPAGNVISRGSWTYGYDKLGRLASATDTASGKVLEYGYDLASNRTSVTENGVLRKSLSFSAANRIDTQAHPEFAYDAYGRLVSDTTSAGSKRRYTWDTSSRLTRVDLYRPETGETRSLIMSYDSVGRLVEKETWINFTDRVERLYFHYQGDRLIAEADDSGLLREYLYGSGESPLGMRARQADKSYLSYFFVTNTHGDVVAVVDSAGNVVSRYAYGPWGEAAGTTEGIHQPFRYAGYRYEDGFDIYYLRTRWYDAGTGRFLSRDKIWGNARDLKSLNSYAYGGSNPPSRVDSSGCSPSQPQDSRSQAGPGCDIDWLEVGKELGIAILDIVFKDNPVFIMAKIGWDLHKIASGDSDEGTAAGLDIAETVLEYVLKVARKVAAEAAEAAGEAAGAAVDIDPWVAIGQIVSGPVADLLGQVSACLFP